MTALCRVDAAREISRRQGPILIPDTCSLLDILRAPVRPQFRKEDGKVLADLAMGMEADTPRATLVLTGQVRRELDTHMQSILDETRQALQAASDAVHSILDRMSWLGDPARHTAVHLHELGHPEVGHDLLRRLLACSVEVTDDEPTVAAAGHRVARDEAPSRQGKQSFKDCLVIEAVLRFALECRSLGSEAPIIFLSANTSDYCEGKGLRLRPPLDAQFAEAGLEFQPRWAAIYRHLT